MNDEKVAAVRDFVCDIAINKEFWLRTIHDDRSDDSIDDSDDDSSGDDKLITKRGNTTLDVVSSIAEIRAD